MSISLNANFELLSAGLYLDARQQFNTIIEMKDFAETSIPDGFITYNKETQKHYVFDSSNTVDATLGKWREYNSGGGITIYDDTEVKSDIASLKEYKQNKTDDTLTTTDKTITGAINEVNDNLLDTVGFSADYKNIFLIERVD